MTTSFRANFKKVSNECKSILEKPSAQTLKRTNFIIVMDSAIQLQSTTAVAPFCRLSPFFRRTRAPHDITWRTHDTSRTWLNHIYIYNYIHIYDDIQLDKIPHLQVWFCSSLKYPSDHSGSLLWEGPSESLRCELYAVARLRMSDENQVSCPLVSNWYSTKSAPMAQQGFPLTQTLRHPISDQWLLT